MFQKLLTFLLVSLLSLTSFSQAIQISDLSTIVSPGKQIRFIKDETNAMDVASIANSNQWQNCTKDVPSFLLSKSSYWLEIKIQNLTDRENLVFEVAHSGLDRVELYQPISGGFTASVLTDSTKISTRAIQNQNYSFWIDLQKNEIKTYYLKVENGDPIHVPIHIGSMESIRAAHTQKDVWFGIFSGILAAMLLANLFIFIRTKERSYLIYVVYIGIVYLTQANFQGYTLRWFLMDAPFLERYATFVLSAAVGISAMFFMFRFLDIKNKYTQARIFVSVYLAAVLLAALGFFQLSFLIIEVNAAALATWMLITAVKLLNQGNRQALNFLVAWVVFLIGVCVFVLKDFGILPYNSFTFNVMTIGSAVETVLLSFALADRINILKKEKEAAQLRELEALKINEQVLEQKVHDRTLQLEEAKNEVQKNYDYLRITQRQLVESEKLSGLGQMTAGIAHELNNPINFVSSNIAPLNRDVDQVLLFMHEFEKLPADASKDEITELKAKYHAADMPYVKSEIDMLMKGIHEGARRTAEIVKGLRIFARADRDTLVKANINECMEATLVVMKSSFKDEVTLTVDLDPNLPELDCYPGKLNQVFVNIIGNAVHATRMDGRDKKDRQIDVKTWADENHLFVSVKDNGKGMDEETKERIFEPFYTTKGVGEGTGLGLSITLGILEEHKGNVYVNTEQNKGTEFLIEIPRNLSQLRAMAA